MMGLGAAKKAVMIAAATAGTGIALVTSKGEANSVTMNSNVQNASTINKMQVTPPNNPVQQQQSQQLASFPSMPQITQILQKNRLQEKYNFQSPTSHQQSSLISSSFQSTPQLSQPTSIIPTLPTNNPAPISSSTSAPAASNVQPPSTSSPNQIPPVTNDHQLAPSKAPEAPSLSIYLKNFHLGSSLYYQPDLPRQSLKASHSYLTPFFGQPTMVKPERSNSLSKLNESQMQDDLVLTHSQSQPQLQSQTQQQSSLSLSHSQSWLSFSEDKCLASATTPAFQQTQKADQNRVEVDFFCTKEGFLDRLKPLLDANVCERCDFHVRSPNVVPEETKARGAIFTLFAASDRWLEGLDHAIVKKLREIYEYLCLVLLKPVKDPSFLAFVGKKDFFGDVKQICVSVDWEVLDVPHNKLVLKEIFDALIPQ